DPRPGRARELTPDGASRQTPAKPSRRPGRATMHDRPGRRAALRWPSERRQLPVDRGHAVLAEELVAATEMTIADETAMRGQRRRMRRAQYQVLGRVDQALLALRVAAPEQEHHLGLMLADHLDH